MASWTIKSAPCGDCDVYIMRLSCSEETASKIFEKMKERLKGVEVKGYATYTQNGVAYLESMTNDENAIRWINAACWALREVTRG